MTHKQDRDRKRMLKQCKQCSNCERRDSIEYCFVVGDPITWLADQGYILCPSFLQKRTTGSVQSTVASDGERSKT